MKIYTAKPYISNEICDNVVDVLKSGNIAQGEKVLEFEEVFSQYCDTKFGATVNSGTAALHSALFAAGIKSGDEVITSPFTFIATANAILMLGAIPVFADIDPFTFNIDPKEIEKKITLKTKAIIPVHLFGLLANMREITSIAKKHNIVVIEDACQAHGAKINNVPAGNWGDMGVFSFYATKNISCGEGGMVVSNNKDYIDKVKSFRHHGQSPKQIYNYIDFGYNYRMTDIHAAIGLGQMKSITVQNKRRQENAEIYNSELSKITGIEIPTVPQDYEHVYHQYTIKINDSCRFTREELVNVLNENDIFPGVFYPKPLHLIKTYREFGYKIGDFPNAEKACQQVLSLPVHPYVQKENIYKIIEIINKL